MKDKKLKKRLVKNSFWSFLTAIISRGGVLIFTIILARFLMPANYGLYSIVLATSMIFFTFADLGISQTLARYISHSLVKDKKKIPSYYKYLLKTKFIFAAAASILLLLLAYPLSMFVYKNEALFLPFLISALYIFILSFDLFYTNIFYSIERIDYLGLKELLNQSSKIILALLVFFLVFSSYQVAGVFAALAITAFILVLFSLFFLRKLLPNLFKKPKFKINKRKVIRFAGYLAIVGISGAFFSHIDSIMLGIFLLSEFVGYYRVAFSIVFGTVGLILAPLITLLPVFTKLNKKKSEKVLRAAFKYMLMIAIPSIFGLLVLGRYFIRFLFGYSYLPATLLLYFLSFLILPIVGVSLLVPFFSAKEKPELIAKLMIATTIVNIVLNFVLIKSLLVISPIWAAAGVGIATLASWIFYFIFALFILKKKFSISISFKPIVKPLISGIVMFGVLVWVLSFIKDVSLITGIFAVILGIFVYFGIMFLIGGIRKEDLNIIKLLLKR